MKKFLAILCFSLVITIASSPHETRQAVAELLDPPVAHRGLIAVVLAHAKPYLQDGQPSLGWWIY